MSNKRADIQGLRGWAITVVVLFHFFPSYFPNGYIGVDIFFVISGFLIAMILTKEEDLDAKRLVFFYYKRIKRILPLYYLAVVAIIMSLLVILPRRYQAVNMNSAWQAIILSSNLKTRDIELDYKRMILGAEDPFTHTWSLCVEMQWYLLAPILFIFQRRMIGGEIAFFPCITLCSALYYSYSNEMVQFYNVFARIWQFAIGVIAFMARNREAESSKSEPAFTTETGQEKVQRRFTPILYAALTLVMVLLSIAWTPISKMFLRFSLTCLSATTLYFGDTDQTVLLNNSKAVYIGDISYALYLIHWPVHVIINIYACNPNLENFTGVITSVGLAALTYHVYEKNYLNKPPWVILLLVAALLAASISLYYKLEKDEDPKQLYGPEPVDYTTININDAAWNISLMRYLNMKESHRMNNMRLDFCTHSTKFVGEDLHHRGYCFNKNGTGNYNILVIGNSYACNQADMVYNAFKRLYKEFNVFCLPGCEVMTNTAPRRCRFQNFNYSRIFHSLKPDLIFVLSRVFTAREPYDVNKPLKNDKIFMDYMTRMSEMEQVYLLQAIPSCVDDCIGAGLEFTKNGMPLRDIKGGLIIEDDFFARERIYEVEKRCKRCEIIDYIPFLVDKNGHYLGYNPDNNLMYLDGVHHFNRFAKERIQHLFNRLAKELQKKQHNHEDL